MRGDGVQGRMYKSSLSSSSLTSLSDAKAGGARHQELRKLVSANAQRRRNPVLVWCVMLVCVYLRVYVVFACRYVIRHVILSGTLSHSLSLVVPAGPTWGRRVPRKQKWH